MSERLAPALVVVRERASGRFLAAGATWTAHVERALVLDPTDARAFVGRFACEPEGIELVTARADAAA